MLFLDELPEFWRDALEVLRQPLEDGTSSRSRARSGTLTFPAQLHAHRRDEPLPVRLLRRPDAGRAPARRARSRRYRKRISGPLLDRIDIHVEVPRVEYEKLTGKGRGRVVGGDPSAGAGARASGRRGASTAARASGVNADMGPAEVRTCARWTAGAQPLLQAAMQQLQLSARALPPRAEAGADDRRPGGGGGDRRAAHRRGAAVPAAGGCGVRIQFFSSRNAKMLR